MYIGCGLRFKPWFLGVSFLSSNAAQQSSLTCCTYAAIAQLVEHRTLNPLVEGSSPSGGTFPLALEFIKGLLSVEGYYTRVAQMVRALVLHTRGRGFKSHSEYCKRGGKCGQR